MDFRKATEEELSGLVQGQDTSGLTQEQNPTQNEPAPTFVKATQEDLNSIMGIPNTQEATQATLPTEQPLPGGGVNWRKATPDELNLLLSGKAPAPTVPQEPIVPAPSLVTKIGDMAGSAFRRIGDYIGSDALSQYGRDVEQGTAMIKEEGLGAVNKAATEPQQIYNPVADVSKLITEISPELTHALTGITPVGEAIPAPNPIRRISTSVAWLLGAGLTGKVLGMGLTKVGLMATPATFTKFGLSPTMASIAARGLGAAEVGGLYGGIGAPFLPQDQSKLLHIGKMAAAFGVFGTAEGMLEGLASKIRPIGEIFKKIEDGKELSPKEQTIAKVVKIAQLSAMGGGAGATEPANTWQERVQNSIIGMASFGLAGVLPFPLRNAIKENPKAIEALQGTTPDGNPVAKEVRLAQLLNVTNEIRTYGGDNKYIADLVYNTGRSFIENGEPIPWEEFDTILSEAMHNAEVMRNQAAEEMGATWHKDLYLKNTPPEPGKAWEWQDLAPAVTGKAEVPAVIPEAEVPAKRIEAGVPVAPPENMAEETRKDYEAAVLRDKVKSETERINNIFKPGTPEHTDAMKKLVQYTLDEIDKQNLQGMDVGFGEMAAAATKPIVPEKIGNLTTEDIRSELTKGNTNLVNKIKDDLGAGVSPDGIRTLIREIYAGQRDWIKLNIPPEEQPNAIKNSDMVMKDIGKFLSDYEGGVFPKTPTPEGVSNALQLLNQTYKNVKDGIISKGQAYTIYGNSIKAHKGLEGYEEVINRAKELQVLTKHVKKPKKVVVDFLGLQSSYEMAVDGIKEAYNKVKEVTPEIKNKLIEFGKDIYEVGQRFVEFVRGMKEAFGDFYKNIKNHMVSVFEAVKEFYSKIPIIGNEAGFLGMPKVGDLKIDDLTKKLEDITTSDTTTKQSVDLGIDMAKRIERSKDTLSQAVAGIKGAFSALLNRIKNPEPWTSYKKAVGETAYEKFLADSQVSKFAEAAVKKIPDKRIREAMNKYIEVDGDMALLRDAAKIAPKDVKWKYELAQKLPADVIKFAKETLAKSYEEDGKYLLKLGWLDSLQENYVRRLVEKGYTGAEKIYAMLRSGLFRTNPGFLKRRMFDTTLEGELAGVRYKDDAILAMTEYKRSFAETIANRTLLRKLTEARTEDGKPLAIVSGIGQLVPRDSVDPEAIIIKPHSLPEEYYGEYESYDHPAMRKWFWLTSDPEGRPVIMQGDLLLHKSIAKHFKNMTGYSKIKQNPFGRSVLKTIREFKGILLSASIFHQVHLGSHAIYHKVNPFNLPEIDPHDPMVRMCVEHGLNPNASDYLEYFEEGCVSTGILTKIPILGEFMRKYNEYVFGNYIPRMKVAMFKRAYPENLERYKKDYTPDQIAEFTAKQTMAAFGEINYKWLGRNPTFQDVMRIMALAPDFLEARGKFVGQAATPYGHEQRAALLRASLGMILIAKITTAILNKDNNPHWERPFSVVVGDKEYMLRSVPGDLSHLIQNPRSFIYHRLNPTVTRTLVEALTGRNELGQQRYINEQFKDFFTTHIPIPLQFVKGDVQKDILDSAFTSMGLTTYQYKTDLQRDITKFIAEHAPKDARTLTELGRLANKKNIKTALELKKPEAMQMLEDAVAAGEISQWDKAKMLRDARKNPTILGFSKIPFDDAVDMFDDGTPEEQKMLLPYMPKKFMNALKHAPPVRQAELRKKYEDFMKKYQGGK